MIHAPEGRLREKAPYDWHTEEFNRPADTPFIQVSGRTFRRSLRNLTAPATSLALASAVAGPAYRSRTNERVTRGVEQTGDQTRINAFSTVMPAFSIATFIE